MVVVMTRMRIMGARKNTNINNFAMKNNRGNPSHLIDMHVKRERIISTQISEIEIERIWGMKIKAVTSGNRYFKASQERHGKLLYFSKMLIPEVEVYPGNKPSHHHGRPGIKLFPITTPEGHHLERQTRGLGNEVALSSRYRLDL